MARFLRTTVLSKLRKPTVVGPAVQQRPVQVYYQTYEHEAEALQRRNVFYRLRPPTVVASPAAPFVARPILLNGVATYDRQASGQQRRTVNWRLRPPTVVAPAASSFVARPLSLNGIATYDRQAVGQQRHTVGYVVRRPVVLAPASPAFVAGKVTTRLAAASPPRFLTDSKLRPPVLAAATPAVVFAAVKVKLVRQSQQFRRTLSRLQPPATLVQAVVAFLAPPRLGRLTRTPQAALRTFSRLRPPVVVNPAVVQRPVATRLAATPRRGFRTRSFYTALPAPAGLATPTLDQLRVRVKLAAQPARQPARFVLRRPAVVSYPVLPEQRRLRVTLVGPPKQGRNAHATLRVPTVVDPAPVAATSTPFGPPSPAAAAFLGNPSAATFAGLPGPSAFAGVASANTLGGLVVAASLTGIPAADVFKPPSPGTT